MNRNICVCCGAPFLPDPEYAEFVLCPDCVRLLEDEAPLEAAEALQALDRHPGEARTISWREANWYRLHFPFSRN